MCRLVSQKVSILSSDSAQETAADTFAWHPDYAGRTFESVHRELTDQIERDQRAYHLALENAEKEEFGAFTTVRDLEKRWSDFDFGWFDTPANQVAARILAFEKARDTKQELLSWQAWRSENQSRPQEIHTMSEEKRDWRENLSDEQRKKIASAMSVGVILLMVLVCIGLYFLIR